MDTGPCLDDEQVMALVAGQLSGSDLEDALQHLEACEVCQALAGAAAPGDEDRSGAAVGEQLGRYTVEAELGSGSMGVVFRAWDPSLDRPVAIKLLNPRKSRSRSARLRLIREAKALAQFSHPNVLPIYDVGRFRDSTFIAMEFVDGETLGSWWEGKSTSEVLRVVLAAGHGLALAHRKGLVHRDFKPANVLVGADGRPRVADFGLVGIESSVDSTSEEHHGADDTINITRAGSIVGTPCYMAPEQLAGSHARALSDQFSFCVVLYEALYGQRPFRGNSLLELRAAIARGPTAPRSAGVAARLFPSIARGLREDPNRRFHSMDDLLGALESSAARRLRRPVLLVGGAVCSTLLVATTLTEPAETCFQEADARELSTRLNESSEALERTAPRLAWLVQRRLDDYVHRWSEAATMACKTEVPTERDAMLECLDVRRVEAEATADFIASGDYPADVVRGLLQELASPVTCLSGDVVEREPSALPGMGARLAATHAMLAKVRLLYNVGALEEAIEVLDEGYTLVEVSGSPSALVRAQLLRGVLTAASGQFEDGAQEIERAYWTALRYRLDNLAHEAAIRLIMTHAERLDDSDAAAVWAKRARALYASVGAVGRAHYHREVARLALRRRDLDAALESSLQAERALEQATAPSDLDRLSILTMLARVYTTRGEHQAAFVQYSAILEGYLQVYGERHPNVAGARLGLAQAAVESGDLEEAEALAELALEQGLANEDMRQLVLISGLDVLASVEERRGNYVSALALRRQVIDIQERAAGASTRGLRSALRSASITLEYAGEHRQALQLRERVLVLTESVDGPESYGAGLSHNNIGASLLALNRHEDAKHHFTLAIRLLTRSDGNESQVRFPMLGLGEVLLALNRPAEALRWAERALLAAQDAEDAMVAAQARSALAQILWRLGDQERALRLADEAQRVLARDPRYEEHHRALVRWRETL